MKILFRLWYAITAGVVLAFTALYSISWKNNKFNNHYGGLALQNESLEDQHMFFVETKGIHSKEPLKTVTTDNFTAYFYEINLLDFDQKYKDIDYIKTYLYPIIEVHDDTLQNKKRLAVLSFMTKSLGDDKVAPFIIKQYLNLDMYVIENMEGEALIPVLSRGSNETHNFEVDKDLLPRIIESLLIYDADHYVEFEQTYLNEPFSLLESDLVNRNKLKQSLENINYLELSKVEQENFQNELKQDDIYFQVSHDSTEFNYIIYITLSIYFVALIVSAYFVFFYKKRNPKLGKVKPSKGFQEYRSKDYDK